MENNDSDTEGIGSGYKLKTVIMYVGIASGWKMIAVIL